MVASVGEGGKVSVTNSGVHSQARALYASQNLLTEISIGSYRFQFWHTPGAGLDRIDA